MKSYTIENLYDKLTAELAWRKKELAIIKSLVLQGEQAEAKKNALIRSSITMLYAHWEGFIKFSATLYLEYVSTQKLPNNKLTSNFVALSIKSILNKASASNRIIQHIEVADFFIDNFKSRSTIAHKNVINTKSNLSSEVLREIIQMLGFDYSLYETKEKLIDERLLASRNDIAHGNYLLIDESSLLDLFEQISTLMNTFKNQIDNAASLKSYKKK